MITASEARRLQKEVYTLRGTIIDSINLAVKNNESQVSINNLNLTDNVRSELVNKGYLVQGNIISWR